MDFGYLRGRYVAGGIELCLEPKRGGVKAKLSLKDALGKKKFSHAVSYSSKDSCWWHTESCLSVVSEMISSLGTKGFNSTEQEGAVVNLLTAVGLLF